MIRKRNFSYSLYFYQCDVQPDIKAVCDIAAVPFVSGSLDNFHMVEHTAGHLALKRIIMDDKQRRASNKGR